MRVKPTIAQQEFIGLDVKVAKSSNPHDNGIEGYVIDETRKTFTVLQKGRKKSVIKKQTVFNFTFPDRTIVQIEGRILLGRSEERLKRRIRRLW